MAKSETHTVEEAAERLGISRGSAYSAVRSGEIPCITIGRRKIIPKAVIDRMLEVAATPGSIPDAAQAK